MKVSKKSGFFISFEGAEGVGKSTQIRRLYKALKKLGYPVVMTREPGGTPLAEALRKIHKSKEVGIWTEVFIILASRADHVQEKIRPWLEQGKIVICDRYQESSYVYQAMRHGLELNLIRKLNKLATGNLQADYIAWLDVPAREIKRRLESRGPSKDRFDGKGLGFHMSIVAAYKRLAKIQKRPKLNRYNACLDEGFVHHQILESVLKAIKASR
ncbi:MAG: dTMP kinase [Deltaproteobacteria bacterium CG11_big_fil_rev_8_21_14_0_20_45_16]|nr:MAG: dTMP kinase [Deltaproteobacteria bacterium CG11_big_fil_rev_8_21_14_0_20_45_16]